ncbi:MAG: YebC/PmpR family DNA-binding transcriptional regulator [Anaerolineales bacterium]|nr:YebC/PmpR family DNA-binding transcriptional regulator [Anaerolineales bacterium]QYK51377.1 MAG: YebC/PmpR family DNA-binding transcriptional regulator [Anaerolineales bacterium]
MSGHSKWSTIKRKKAVTDAKRGAVFTRLAREITIAAREGGGSPETNFTLRLAIDKAKGENMPSDNIDRAIKRGTGEDKDGATLEQVTYEGFGPNGVAVIVEAVTDNRNRTVSELRHAFSRHGGTLGESGSVNWQFDRVAFFAFAAQGKSEEELFELVVEAGADDIWYEDGQVEVTGPVDAFKRIGDALRQASIAIDDAGLRMQAKQELEMSANESLQVLRFIESLEELDDVQATASNLKISDEALAQLS